jgi:F5/8 type C domain
MIRSFLMLLLFIAVSPCHGRDVTARWLPNPENNVTYRVYRGIDLLVATPLTYAVVQAETGDTLGLVAVNESGSSDIATTVVKSPPPKLNHAEWNVTASSAETVREDNKPENAIDGNPATLWHTTWGLTLAPHYYRIELPRPAMISGLRYLPRQDGGTNGIVTGYEVETSMDGATWTSVAEGAWPNDATWKRAILPLTEALHVRLWGSDPRMAAAEIELEGSYVPEPPANVTLTLQQSSDLSEWSDLSEITTPKAERQFFRIKIETP